MTDDFWNDIRLRKEILNHIENETFILTKHAAEEQKNDNIDLQDTIHVLKTGFHENEKTGFDNKFQIWKYAIKGKTETFQTVIPKVIQKLAFGLRESAENRLSQRGLYCVILPSLR